MSCFFRPVRGVSFHDLSGLMCCVLGRIIIFSVDLSPARITNEYLQTDTKPNEMRGVDLQWTIIPSRGVDRHTTYHFVLQTSGINLSSHRLLYLHHHFLSLFSVSIFSKMEIMISIELKEACMRCKVRALLRAFAVTYVRSSIRLFKSVIYH